MIIHKKSNQIAMCNDAIVTVMPPPYCMSDPQPSPPPLPAVSSSTPLVSFTSTSSSIASMAPLLHTPPTKITPQTTKDYKFIKLSTQYRNTNRHTQSQTTQTTRTNTPLNYTVTSHNKHSRSQTQQQTPQKPQLPQTPQTLQTSHTPQTLQTSHTPQAHHIILHLQIQPYTNDITHIIQTKKKDLTLHKIPLSHHRNN